MINTMWYVILFLAQVAVVVYILDIIWQLLHDFLPSWKTVGLIALILGYFGIKKKKEEKENSNNT